MKWPAYLNTCLARAVRVLQLPAAALPLLKKLRALDLDATVAESARQQDSHQRPGILSWSMLAQHRENVRTLEDAAMTLEGWGIVQVVGRDVTDAVVPGSAGLRLTAWGRVCLGLGPELRLPITPEDGQPWHILHGAGYESLRIEAMNHAGSTDVIAPEGNILALCGRVAASLCARGGAIVDGHGASTSLLEQLLDRTREAAAPRAILLKEPGELRVAALHTRSRLRWIEPQEPLRHSGRLMDGRLDGPLGGVPADARGVADSELAQPRRVNVPLSALLLPPGTEARMRQVIASARYPTRNGYRLLLSGPPGTGKSTTAAVLATLLEKSLVRLDLSSILSKWLGETERHIGQVFDVVEDAGAVLALDEAEALMRQRGGESGALSTGVAYLLTRLERFSGILVATTNRAQDLDEAFFRRFDDYIKLPLPDPLTLRRLWASYLPSDHRVDTALISDRFAISGGLVRGAAQRAISWNAALHPGEPISTAVALAALGRELEKSNRSSQEVLIEPHRSKVQRLLDGTDF